MEERYLHIVLAILIPITCKIKHNSNGNFIDSLVIPCLLKRVIVCSCERKSFVKDITRKDIFVTNYYNIRNKKHNQLCAGPYYSLLLNVY